VSIRIGSNIPALQAQRRLSRSSQELGDVFQRLASGQRINRASDDAAGLAIADRLRSDGRLYTQSIANINDGISAISVLDGALEQRGAILQRLGELAEQSANGAISSSQRGSLGNEYRELSQELARIKESTNFNGLDLFDPSVVLAIQAGISGGANSRINIDGVDLGNTNWTINTSDLVDVADWDHDGTVDGTDFLDFINSFGPDSVDFETLKTRFGANWTTTTVVDSQGQNRTVFIGAAKSTSGLTFLTFTSNASGTGYSTRNGDAFTQFMADFNSGGGNPTPSSTGNTDFTLDDGLGGTFKLDRRVLRLSDTQSIAPSQLTLSSVDSIATARAAIDRIRTELETVAQQRGKVGAGESRLRVALNLSSVASLQPQIALKLLQG
jgi:flagellin